MVDDPGLLLAEFRGIQGWPRLLWLGPCPLGNSMLVSAQRISSPSFLLLSETPIEGAAPKVALQLPPLSSSTKATIAALETKRVEVDVRELAGSWINFLTNNFRCEIYADAEDTERAKAELAKLSSADLKKLKKLIMQDHPRYWEVGRHEALADPTMGPFKAQQIDRVCAILSGSIFEGTSDGRAVLGRLTRLCDHLCSSTTRMERPSDISGLRTSLESAKARCGCLASELANDAPALRRMLTVEAKLDRFYRIVKELDERIDADFVGLRRQLAEGTMDLHILDTLADPDTFLDRLLGLDKPPGVEGWQGTDRWGFQPTPYHAIRQLIEKVGLGPSDVLADLGCGTGRVLQAVSFLTGCKGLGVEYDLAMAEFAQRSVTQTGLTDRVLIQCGDAAKADVDQCNVFYMFNPFGGETKERVLKNLFEVAKKHRITVCTTGPISVEQPWLRREGEASGRSSPWNLEISVFKSDPALCQS